MVFLTEFLPTLFAMDPNGLGALTIYQFQLIAGAAGDRLIKEGAEFTANQKFTIEAGFTRF